MPQSGVCLLADNSHIQDGADLAGHCQQLRPRALKLAAGMLAGDLSRAEDLVQEAFLRLHAARGRYQSDAESIRRYALRVLGNLCLDELRRRKTGLRIMEEAGAINAERAERRNATPDRQLARSERRDAVNRAVARLPQGERVALLLRELGGMSYSKIAEELETSSANVNNLIHRARSRFAAMMRPWMEEGV
jgi:RNA polymerase sigma-70 factor, ECF subfamily